jgi:hypothetical protein
LTRPCEIAVAKAGFNVSNSARLDADHECRRKRSPRGRHRPDPLAACSDSKIVPMLRASLGLRPITVLLITVLLEPLE